MNKYKAILFDFDGTIIDTNDIIIQSWQYMARETVGHELSYDEILSTFGIPLYDAMVNTKEKYGVKCSADEMCDIYRYFQHNLAVDTRHPFDGIKEMLEELKKTGIRIGIVTSRTNTSTMQSLKEFGLWDYFDAIIGADDTDIHKPNPEPALLCCEKLGVDPKNSLMVGDSVFDLQCGHNAGGDACFVKWSFCTSTEKAEAEASPEYMISYPTELISLVSE